MPPFFSDQHHHLVPGQRRIVTGGPYEEGRVTEQVILGRRCHRRVRVQPIHGEDLAARAFLDKLVGRHRVANGLDRPKASMSTLDKAWTGKSQVCIR